MLANLLAFGNWDRAFNSEKLQDRAMIELGFGGAVLERKYMLVLISLADEAF